MTQIIFQARAKLPKKRRRVVNVDLDGPGGGGGGGRGGRGGAGGMRGPKGGGKGPMGHKLGE